MKRRDVVLASVGLLPAAWIGTTEAQSVRSQERIIDVFIDESGRFGQPYFTTGALVCDKSSVIAKRLKGIRKALKYKRQLSGVSADIYKVPYFQRVVADWLEHKDFQIFVRVQNASPAVVGKSPSDRTSSYVGELVAVIGMKRLRGNSKIRILQQPRRGEAHGDDVEKLLKERIAGILEIKRPDPVEDELRQLLDVVMGTMRQSVIDATERRAPGETSTASPRTRAKRLCRETLLKSFKIRTITAGINHANCMLRVF